MNPEFRRYLWLELTTHRLIGMPAVLLAALWLVYVLNDSRLDSTVATVALWGYAALAFLWGTRLAAESVNAELGARTWDGQRMSALEPWSMAWAKLFGSTVYVWYGCAVCAVAFLAASAAGDGSMGPAAGRLALVTGAALVAHSVSLMSSLHGVYKHGRDTPARGAGVFSLGLVVAVPFMLLGTAAADGRPSAQVTWFALQFDAFGFAITATLAFAAWSVVGVYRLMRIELQRRNGPWVWLAFALFCVLFAAGFANDERLSLAGFRLRMWNVFSARALLAFLVAVVLVWAMALIEPKDPVEYRRLGRAAAGRRWAEAGEVVPRWLLALALAAVLGAATVLGAAGAGVGAVPVAAVLGFTGAVLAFACRDVALLVLLNLAPRSRRADAAGFLYLVVLYLLIPAILAALGLERLRPLLLPGWESGLAALVPPVVEAAVLAALVRARWRRHYGDLAAVGQV